MVSGVLQYLIEFFRVACTQRVPIWIYSVDVFSSGSEGKVILTSNSLQARQSLFSNYSKQRLWYNSSSSNGECAPCGVRAEEEAVGSW